MVRKNKRKKEEIAEDWCFVCKDGGLLMVCDYRDCLKAYHPCCVGKDDSFLENGRRWTCDSHFCSLCRKASKFKCLCCPSAVCGSCIYTAEFATIKGSKGFCSHCAKLALLIEENAHVDSDGGEVDFKDRETYECLFLEYYEIVKEKEGLDSLHVHSARNSLKKRRNKYDLDLDVIDEGEYDAEESEDLSNFIVSDSDDLIDTGSKSARKKKDVGKLKSMNGKVKDKEFIGWGSRSLIEFLQYIGKDTSREFSERDVVMIIIEYCIENKLFDPEKKRKVLCDAQLRSLLGRKSVNRNNIQNLLAPHFADNVEEMDDSTCILADRDDCEPFQFSTQRKHISSPKPCPNLVSKECQSGFAAIVSSNIKLVYLKRSLVEVLLKQPETFDEKVLGSFVRIKSDPYDYLQKNSHLLVQVVGINRSSCNDEINKEIWLQFANVPKDVLICKISDDDFSKEECKDLYQRMRNGLVKQPTILELEQKARSLHQDIIKHWIPRELALLQKHIDHANEKGWRRELFEYMDQKLKLEAPSEQSRLLSDIPKIIPEIVDTPMPTEGPPIKDRLEQNGSSELAIGETGNFSGHKHNVVQDVGNDKGVQTLDSSETKGEIPQSNKELRVYIRSRRSLQQKAIQPIISTRGQVVSVDISLENVLDLDPKTPVKKSQDGAACPAHVEQLSVCIASEDNGTSQRKLPQSTSNARQDDPKATRFEEINLDSPNSNPANCGLHQPGNIKSDSQVVGSNQSATRNAKQVIKERQSLSGSVSVKMSVSDKQDTKISAIPMEEQKFSISTADVIVLSDNDEEEANIADMPVRRKVVENPEISIWHCVGPYGEKGGPYSMSVLKRWSETNSYPLEFKVWKTGQSETQAIPLSDVLSRIFSST